MLIPQKLKRGDVIGVVAPSNPITDENIEELERARKIVENAGFKVNIQKIFSLTLMDIVLLQKKRQKI